MIAIDIPGWRELRLNLLVLDYNGTLAVDGKLLPGVATMLTALAKSIRIHVVTADTFGSAADELTGLPVALVVVPSADQADRKLEFIATLDPHSVVAIGNGRNDRKMIEVAALGIALVQGEGSAVETLTSADVVATDVLDALALLQHPKRLEATLRS
jgi:soluble P-type ATPase